MNTSQAAIQIFLIHYKTQLEHLESGSLDQNHLTRIIDKLANQAHALGSQLQKSKERLPDVLLQQVQQLVQQFATLQTRQPQLQSLESIQQALAQHYEHFLHHLRQYPAWRSVVHTVGTLRPTNYSRNIVHVCNSLVAFALYEWIFNRTETLLWLSLFLAGYISLDVARRYSPALNKLLFQRLLAAVTRPRELYQTPSGIWYVAGLLMAALIAPHTAALCAVLTLGFGDPAASFFGKKYGRISIGKNRTLTGSLAFVLASSLAVSCFLLCMRSFDWATALQWAALCGLSGCVGEYLSNDQLDDNLVIPTSVAFTLALLYGFT